MSDSVVGSKDQFVNLRDVIDGDRAEALNASSKTYIKSILTSRGVLRSDQSTDPQLLIKVPFRNVCKLRGIKFFAHTHSSIAGTVTDESADGAEESGPKHVKIYVNAPNMSFHDTDTQTATDDVVLHNAELDGNTEKKVKFVKYQKVHSVTIFIASNQGNTDVTVLNGIEFIGSTVDGMDVNAIKKVGEGGVNDH